MKKIIFITLLIVSSISVCYAQDTNDTASHKTVSYKDAFSIELNGGHLFDTKNAFPSLLMGMVNMESSKIGFRFGWELDEGGLFCGVGMYKKYNVLKIFLLERL